MQGINVSPLSIQHRFKPARSGLLMGFAAADQSLTSQSLRKMARVLSGFGGRGPGRSA
ncbi:MAG: hypothetical protein U1E15_08340 [Hyphomicrobiales bacterium]